MSLTQELGLLSGRAATVQADPEEQVDTLILRAQTMLGVRKARLVKPFGCKFKFKPLPPLLLPSLETDLSRPGAMLAMGGDPNAVQDQLKNVQQIHASFMAFATILGDGRGKAHGGGDSSAVRDQLQSVQQIETSELAFAAILSDRSVLTWGDAQSGGGSSAVRDQLKNVPQVQAAVNAFAAIVDGGSVVTWGYAHAGGECECLP